MSETSSINLNNAQLKTSGSMRNSVAGVIKRLEDEQKANMLKQTTGRQYESYTEMNLDVAEESLTMVSNLSVLSNSRSILKRAKSDMSDLSNGIASIIKLAQSFKQDVSRLSYSSSTSLNKNAIQQSLNEFRSALQGLLNSKSSWKSDYIFSGQKVATESVDLSQNSDEYYKGSEFNQILLLQQNSYEFSFNGGDESIKNLVEVIEIIDHGLQSGLGPVLQKLDDSITSLTSSKYRLDLTAKNMESYSVYLEENFIEQSNAFQEINAADQTQIMLEFQKTKTQLNAIGASQKYVNFELANYL